MEMMAAVLTFAFTSPPGKAEASVLGTATWTTETVLLVPGEILMVCRGKGKRQERKGRGSFSVSAGIMSSPDLMILFSL